MLDITRVRSHFPSLLRCHNGAPVVYFDNPAGTQVPQSTIDGYGRYFERHNANVGGSFSTSVETEEIIEQARAGMAEFLHAPASNSIVFGPNMTTLTFALSRAIGRILQAGDEIVTTRLEHDANVAPWLALQERGIVIRWIDVDLTSMTLDLESAEAAIGPRTRVVACGYASNAFGTVNDVARIAEMAHAVGAWLFVDAVHYAPHGPIDVQALGCDFLVCSAYKFFGPHLGILYGRDELLAAIPSYKVRPAADGAPGKWETGTGNFEAMSALLGTLDYLRSVGDSRQPSLHDSMEAIRHSERRLTERLLAGMTALPGVRVYGLTDPADFDCRVPTVSFTIDGVEPEAAAAILGERGIFSWASNHYAVEPLQCLHVRATQRIGLVHYNTSAEIDRFLSALETITHTTQRRAATPPLEGTITTR